MSMRPILKEVHCAECKNRFNGDFSTIGMAQKRHILCEECRKELYQRNKK